MTTLIGFMKGMRTLAWPWQVWVAGLALANGVMPLFFLGHAEARGVLAAMALAAAVMLGIFRAFGFVRLLGLGHIVAWVPLLLWLAPRLDAIGTEGVLGIWLLALVALNGISVVIDVIDVVRYLAGARTPTFTVGQV